MTSIMVRRDHTCRFARNYYSTCNQHHQKTEEERTGEDEPAKLILF